MTKFKAGDKVRLVGEEVMKYHPTTEYATMVSDYEYRLEGKGEVELYVCRGWEVELIEEEKESTVGAKFEDVQVGDRVRLTAANGDVVEFTAVLASAVWMDSVTNSYSVNDWEKVEILTRAKKPLVPGLYESNRKDLSLVVSTDGTAYATATEGSWETVPEDRARFLIEHGGMELAYAF